MADFNKILDPGDIQGGVVNVVNEIPTGSSLKIEWNRDLAVFELDRVEPAIFAKPINYGFVPQTLDEDGDELDVLTVCHEPIPTGVVFKAKLIGVMRFEDDAEVDDKLVVVPEDDRHSGNSINSLADLPAGWQQQVEYHFSHYKDLKKPGTTIVQGWGDASEAKRILAECAKRWQQ